MQAPFHWLRVETFVYATEDEERVLTAFASVAGPDEYSAYDSESEHGNRMTVLQSLMSHRKEQEAVFTRLGPAMAAELHRNAPEKIDDDCILYLRLDKQKAVQGEFAVAHHGDVISVTGKVASNPARREIAVANLRAFLEKLYPELQAQS